MRIELGTDRQEGEPRVYLEELWLKSYLIWPHSKVHFCDRIKSRSREKAGVLSPTCLHICTNLEDKAIVTRCNMASWRQKIRDPAILVCHPIRHGLPCIFVLYMAHTIKKIDLHTTSRPSMTRIQYVSCDGGSSCSTWIAWCWGCDSVGLQLRRQLRCSSFSFTILPWFIGWRAMY